MKKSTFTPASTGKESPALTFAGAGKELPDELFLRQLADRLRNPLTGALGNLQLLLEQLKDILNEDSAASPEQQREKVEGSIKLLRSAIFSTAQMASVMDEAFPTKGGSGVQRRRLFSAEKVQAESQFRHRVLIVEDNIVNQKVLKKGLENLGCECFVASDGQKGVDYFKENPLEIDIIFMDVIMPNMDGNKATIEIRKIEKENAGLRSVPIIRLSSNTANADVEESERAGMTTGEGLGKPFQFDRIEVVLERHSLATSSGDEVLHAEEVLEGGAASSSATPSRTLRRVATSPQMT